MEEHDIKDLDELRLSNLPNYLEKLNQNIINLHKEFIKKDNEKNNYQKDIQSITPIRKLSKKIIDKENIKYEKKNHIYYNINKEQNSFYSDNKKQNNSKDTKTNENKSFIETNNQKYKKVFIQKFPSPTSRKKKHRINIKKTINNSLERKKKNLDISEVNCNKRKSINNKIKNELGDRSLSKSRNKYTFKPRKSKNDCSFNKNEKKNINFENNDIGDKIITSPRNKRNKNDNQESLNEEIKTNNKKKFLIFPKKIISENKINSLKHINNNKNNINDNKKDFLIFDLLNMILLYNEYIISELQLNNHEKIIMTQYSSFLIDKILILKENKIKNNNNNEINIDIKEKSAKIIQRKWRKNIIKKNIQYKKNSNINYELRKMVVNNFIEKEKNKTKNIFNELNNTLNSYSLLNIKDDFFKEIIKLIKGINIQEKYYYYKEYINRIILNENLF